jgi:hypothetical protein
VTSIATAQTPFEDLFARMSTEINVRSPLGAAPLELKPSREDFCPLGGH